MPNLYKTLAQINEQRKKYFQKPLYYGEKVKKIVLKFLPDAQIRIFGSVVKGQYLPESDFDVLIVTKTKFPNLFAQTKIKTEIIKHFPDAPFEIHIVSPKEFKNWYRRFIKTDYLKV